MRLTQQECAALAFIFFSTPALSSIVNGAPVPANQIKTSGIEQRNPNPQFGEILGDVVEGLGDVTDVASGAGKALDAGAGAVNSGKSLWNALFDDHPAPKPSPSAKPHKREPVPEPGFLDFLHHKKPAEHKDDPEPSASHGLGDKIKDVTNVVSEGGDALNAASGLVDGAKNLWHEIKGQKPAPSPSAVSTASPSAAPSADPASQKRDPIYVPHETELELQHEQGIQHKKYPPGLFNYTKSGNRTHVIPTHRPYLPGDNPGHPKCRPLFPGGGLPQPKPKSGAGAGGRAPFEPWCHVGVPAHHPNHLPVKGHHNKTHPPPNPTHLPGYLKPENGTGAGHKKLPYVKDFGPIGPVLLPGSHGPVSHGPVVLNHTKPHRLPISPTSPGHVTASHQANEWNKELINISKHRSNAGETDKVTARASALQQRDPEAHIPVHKHHDLSRPSAAKDLDNKGEHEGLSGFLDFHTPERKEDDGETQADAPLEKNQN